MFCQKCGAKLDDNAFFCPSCGARVAVENKEISTTSFESNTQYAPSGNAPKINEQKPACPDNHLVKSILFTVLLCWPFGIPAIVNAAKVNTAYMNGEYEKAQTFSNEANKWCNVAMWVGIGFWALYLLYIVLFVSLI